MHAGGFNQLSVPNKVVHQYSNPAAGNRCHVQILDLYFSKLPKKAFEEDNFYVRPLERVPTDEGTPWFTSVPVGKNTLSGMTKTMCTEAGVSGNKTNHSLRAYAVTEMYNAGIPEKVIQDRSGHRSIDGLRKYEKISEQQKESACLALEVDCASVVDSKNYNMQVSGPTYSFQQQQLQPNLTFGSSTFNSCTINVYQAPQNTLGMNKMNE